MNSGKNVPYTYGHWKELPLQNIINTSMGANLKGRNCSLLKKPP